MRRISLIGMCILFSFATVGCVGSTDVENYKDVPCVGLSEDARDPRFNYSVKGWNVAMGIIFFETILAPVFLLTDYLYCPTSLRQLPAEKQKSRKLKPQT